MLRRNPDDIIKYRQSLEDLLGPDIASNLSNGDVWKLTELFLSKSAKVRSDLPLKVAEGSTSTFLHREARKIIKERKKRIADRKKRKIASNNLDDLINAVKTGDNFKEDDPDKKTNELDKSLDNILNSIRSDKPVDKDKLLDTQSNKIDIDDLDAAMRSKAQQSNKPVGNPIETYLVEMSDKIDALHELQYQELQDEKEDQKRTKKIAKKYAKRRNERIKAENKQRKQREKESEKSLGAIIGFAKTMLSPVKDIIDNIVRFITNTFLGKVFVDILDWATNPENQGKVSNILRFLKDWWPAILTSYILFGTSFGKFIRGMVGFTIKGIGMLASAITYLKGMAAKGKFGQGVSRILSSLPVGGKAALIGLAVAGTVAGTMAIANAISGKTKEEDDAESSIDIIESPQFSGGGVNETKNISSKKLFDATDGGVVRGERGVDKNLGWLSDGEIVLTEKARDRAIKETGIDPLKFNEDGSPSANRPKVKNSIYYAAGGGAIGRDKYNYSNNITNKFIPHQFSPSFNLNSLESFVGSPVNIPSVRSSTKSPVNIPSVSSFVGPFVNMFTNNSFSSSPTNISNSNISNSNISNFNISNSDTYSSMSSDQNVFQRIINNIIHSGDDMKSGSRIIKENTGMDIPGGTADRQRMSINVQPGEAHVIVPNEVVQRGGLYHIENIINMYDDGTSFASRNSGSRIIPNPPSMREPRVTVIPSETTSSTQIPNQESIDIPMLDASFVSSRKLKTLGVV